MNLRRIAAVGALAAVLALSGCSSIPGLFGGPVRDDDGTITEGGDLSVTSLGVGDCFDDVNTGGVTASVEAIPCDEAHVYEAFHDFALPDGEFPGDEAVDEAAASGCLAAFEDFIGLAYDDSVLEMFYFLPTEESWVGADDRLVTCAVGSEGVRVTGSAEGSAE